jgi:nucleoside-diphosphate-sugar epimerase
MRVFVTGAASPLGRVLVAALRRRGDRVIGLVRRLNGVALMRNLGAEPIVGDVRRPEALVKGMDGCDAVIHLASFFDFWSRRADTYEQVNVSGTKHTIAAAVVARIPRMVFCSSALTIGEQPGERGDEFTRHRGYTLTAVEQSKLEAERVALKLRGKGIEIVVANPSLIVAPGDPGWTGRLISDFLRRRRLTASDAPASWVWVEDAAMGLLKALEQGKDGERYVLSGDTMSPRQLLSRVAKIAGLGPPMTLSPGLALASAMLATAFATPFGRRPRLSLDEARFARVGFRVDGSHASAELGVEYTPMSRYLPVVVASYRKALDRFAA